ncbi:MAG: hypothetical protein GX333_00330 [Syntrophomonadaceae bacterium]|nr:hypothetical protein [Syntrophomonadaceae bacterium]
MKIESLNLHGISLEEALQKLETNLNWCIKHSVEVLDINHGKGLHSNRNFSVIKSEVRKLLKSNHLIKENNYIIVWGESNLPIALTYDEGHTLIVKKGIENSYIGGKKQIEKNYRIFSDEGKKQRKMNKNINRRKRSR